MPTSARTILRRGYQLRVFLNETGGNLFYNRNDIANEIKRSQELGSEYYTLTYEPHVDSADGRFRRVRVTLRDLSLRAFTKAGYFAPNQTATVHPRKQRLVDLSEAARASIPFPALGLTYDGWCGIRTRRGRVSCDAEVRKYCLATGGRRKEHGEFDAGGSEPQ